MTGVWYSPSVLDDIRVAPSSTTRLMFVTLVTKVSVYSRMFLVAESKEFEFAKI
jgi:hypothetical protein